MAAGQSSSVVSLADVLGSARNRPCADAVRVIGIDGPSASGKSTLARRLRALAPTAALIQCDDFLSWTDLETWWPRFEAEVLRPLRAGHAIRYQVRDWIGDEFGSSVKHWKRAKASPLVIVEGVGSTRAQAQVDYAIWVEAPDGQRLDRGLARDGEDHLGVWRNFQQMEQRFFAEDRTKQRADLCIDGAPCVPHDPATEAVTLDAGARRTLADPLP